jgi:hypothetical protein
MAELAVIGAAGMAVKQARELHNFFYKDLNESLAKKCKALGRIKDKESHQYKSLVKEINDEYAALDHAKYLKSLGLIGGTISRFKRIYNRLSGSYHTNGINYCQLFASLDKARKLSDRLEHDPDNKELQRELDDLVQSLEIAKLNRDLINEYIYKKSGSS